MPINAPAEPLSTDSRAPLALLLLTLAFTMLATALVAVMSIRHQWEIFARDVDVTRRQIAYRLETYVSLLRGGAGFFSATGGPSREAFGSYVERLQVQEYYPGIQGIGYTARVDPAEREAFEKQQRSEGVEGFRIRPESRRDELHAVIYLEPANPRNRTAIGYDMHSEVTRAAAMDAARDLGLPVATGKVTLMQEITANKQPGFLIYLPVYRNGETPESLEERREQLAGFVYGAFRAHDFFHSATRSLAFRRLGFEVYDGDALDPEQLMFRMPAEIPVKQRLVDDNQRITVAEHVWRIRFAGGAELGLAAPRIIIPLVGGSGLLISLLLFAGTRHLAMARQAAEQNAQQAAHSRRLFERIAATTPDVIFIRDLSAERIVYANPETARALGYPPEEILEMGASWLIRLVHPEDREAVKERDQLDAAAAAEFRSQEVRLHHANGSYRWFLSRTVVFSRSTAGGAHQLLELATDITERRAAEEALRTAYEAKDKFLAALSHELRTPLTPVLAAVSSLEDSGAVPADLQDELKMIRRNTELEARLIDDLLDLTRITRGKLSLHLEPTDLRELVEHCVSTVVELREKELRVSIEWDAADFIISGDHSRLMQVFWNLLKNAAKFSSEGGGVRIAARNEPGEPRSRPWLIVEVVDEGIGIEKEALPRIFNAFEQGSRNITRSFGGLGLGLAITHSIVELHHGSITASSEGPGKGACFSVRLPTIAAKSAMRRTERIQSPAQDTGRGGESADSQPERSLHILLVEDHEDTAQILAKRLTQAGHRVTHAGTIAAAREAAAAVMSGAVADKGAFDLVLSDLGLPDGSGLELMPHLRETYALRGIALSGYGMENDLRRSAEAGFQRHLIKPVNFDQLRQAVQEVSRGDFAASAGGQPE